MRAGREKLEGEAMNEPVAPTCETCKYSHKELRAETDGEDYVLENRLICGLTDDFASYERTIMTDPQRKGRVCGPEGKNWKARQ